MGRSDWEKKSSNVVWMVVWVKEKEIDGKKDGENTKIIIK